MLTGSSTGHPLYSYGKPYYTSSALVTPSVNTDSFPEAEECLAHLALLEAFVHRRCQVTQSAGEHSWHAYVKAASVKFAKWVSAINQKPSDGIPEPPSLDVLMVWHAFMLNPVKYAQFEKLTLLPRKGVDWARLPNILNNPFDIPTPSLTTDTTTTATSPSFTITTPAGQPAPIPFDLPAAVHRQHAFATKMTRYAWHRSPHAPEIMHRSIARYANFFSLLKINHQTARKRDIAVPTLDVDLVWHTHQLRPGGYRDFARVGPLFDSSHKKEGKEGGFINHDDTLPSPLLHSSFHATQSLYRAVFGAEYDICLCWVCAAASAGPDGPVGDVRGLRGEVGGLVEKESTRLEEMGLVGGADLARVGCRLCGEHGGRGCAVEGEGDGEGEGGCGSGCGEGGCGGCGGR